jgi:hypothetical protein
MTNLQHLEPRFRYTVCSAVRDIYQVVDDEEVKRKLRYIMMLSKIAFTKLKEEYPLWMKDFFPTRGEFPKIMGGEIP